MPASWWTYFGGFVGPALCFVVFWGASPSIHSEWWVLPLHLATAIGLGTLALHCAVPRQSPRVWAFSSGVLASSAVLALLVGLSLLPIAGAGVVFALQSSLLWLALACLGFMPWCTALVLLSATSEAREAARSLPARSFWTLALTGFCSTQLVVFAPSALSFLF